MRRRLAGIALCLERAAVVGDDVARVVDGFWRPQLDYRQLTGRTLFAPRARRTNLTLVTFTGEQLPKLTRTSTRPITRRDERATIFRDDVVYEIFRVRIV